MTWTLRRDYTVDAAHSLPNYDGPCARLHGHTWKVTVEVQGDTLQEDGPHRGMLIDYHGLDAAVRPVLALFDHHHLNTIEGLMHPTAERIAQWLCFHLRDQLPCITAVEVWETACSFCRYEP